MRALVRLRIVVGRHVPCQATLLRKTLAAIGILALKRLFSRVGAHMSRQSPLRFKQSAAAREGALIQFRFPPFGIHVSLLLRARALILNDERLGELGDARALQLGQIR